jgi:hypothetical protein
LASHSLNEHLEDVHDGKPPGFGGLVIDPANLVLFKDGWWRVHR